jgi:hypothetical protein
MDYFSLDGGPDVVNTGALPPATSVDPSTQEKFTTMTGATIINKLIVGNPPAYSADLGSSYLFPEAMGADGQYLALDAPGNRLVWVDASSGSGGDINNGGNSGAITVGSTTGTLTLIAPGLISVGSGASNHIFLNGGVVNLHADVADPGPVFDLSSNQYSVAFTNSGVDTVRLPPANANVGRSYIIHHAHSGGPITLEGSLGSGDTIDGIAAIPINANGSHIKVISIGNGKWNIA